MRSISNDTALRISRQGGEEPVVVLSLTIGDQTYWLSDRKMASFTTDDRLETVGHLASQARIDNVDRWVGSMSSMNFAILDEDELFRTALESQVMQGSDAVAYLAFEGQGLVDWTVLLRGRVEEAPVWQEESRTLNIVVETPRRLDAVPLTPGTTDDCEVDEEFEGQTWPMIFGDGVRDVEAQQVTVVPVSRTVEDFDQTNVFTFIVEDADEDFPQDEAITLQVDDEWITGSFSGETFAITARQVDRHPNFPATGTGAEITLPLGYRAVGSYVQISKLPFGTVGESPIFTGYCHKQIGDVAHIYNGNSQFIIDPSWSCRINRYPFPIAQGAQWTHKAGTQVTQVNIPVTYVVSENPMLNLKRVSAFRQVTNTDGSYSRRELVALDEGLYTVTLEDPAYCGATTITLPGGLLSARGSGWSDVLFASGKAGTGSNTADIIEWLVLNRTEFAVNAASFALVRAAIENYPMNFGISSSVDVLDLISQIAWQNRMGVTWNGDEVVLTYLSAIPDTPVMSVNDDNITEGGITETATPVTDLTTIFNAEWRRNGNDKEPRKITYKNNVALFGRREKTFSFWAFQKRDLVDKSATFWAHRYSTSWRRMKVNLWGLEGLAVDPFDYVTWNVGDFYAPAFGLTFRNDMSPDGFHVMEMQLNVAAGSVVADPDYFTDDENDEKPDDPTITPGATAIEIAEAGVPQALSFDETPQTTFAVIAVGNEENAPNSVNFKTVLVRIKSSDEISTQKEKDGNAGRIAEIDTLDPPPGLNGTLQAERVTLTNENVQLDITLGQQASGGEEVVATNGGVGFMLINDTGTMIRVDGGAYFVQPDQMSGPLRATITKEPESPAEGKFFGNIAGSQLTSLGDSIREITILGDPSSVEVGDQIEVFRDSDGIWFGTAPAGAPGTAVKRLTLTGVKTSSTSKRYLVTDADITSVTILNIDNSAELPNGFVVAAFEEDGVWYASVPLWL